MAKYYQNPGGDPISSVCVHLIELHAAYSRSCERRSAERERARGRRRTERGHRKTHWLPQEHEQALRQQAAAREKERQRRKREREVRDLLDQVVRGTVNGIAGIPLPERPPWQIGGFRREWDQTRRRVIYRDSAGGEAFAVSRHLISGPGLARDDALRAALVVASAKFGGEVRLTGSAEFRRRAEQQARALGIRVINPIDGTERGKSRGIDEGR